MSETEHIQLTPEQLTAITSDQAWHYRVIPTAVSPDGISLLVDETMVSPGLSDELELLLNRAVRLEGRSPELISRTLNTYYRKGASAPTSVAVPIHQADDFLQQLVLEAKGLGSSDIHIEIYEEKVRVRIRIDGLLVERYKLMKSEYPALINKIKIKANLDIAEKRLPQDGRIFFQHGDQKFDIRVSILPTLHGEKVVMRLLSSDATNVHIDRLGFSRNQLDMYLEGIRKPHGIILISGPTGSGKTTTLYATLKILNEEKRNILTVEDPIEYTLEGINQVQLKESIGLTFASALRTFLRQDPDVIMLGEIRDGETAQMAIRAALTGHLVLSTIHTNSAWGTISRLIDMGVPPFLLAGTLNTSVAQRLVRKLCNSCKRPVRFSTEMIPKGFRYDDLSGEVFEPAGCEHCHYTGYKGRIALYEVIPIDQDLGLAIRQSKSEITEELKERNIIPLHEHAFNLFKEGITSADEVYPLLLNQ